MISVIIPLFNKEEVISRTIESVLSQTYINFEVVVVDDGSTDNSVRIVKSYNDSRIRIITQDNSGVSAARNRGIAEAKGDFIAFLDADDEWLPDCLETYVNLAHKFPHCAVYAVNYKMSGSDGSITDTIINNLPFNTETGEITNYFEVASTSHPPICSISIMAKKMAFNNVGGFPIGVRSGEDLLTWARLACSNRIAYTRKVCAVYNMGDGYDFNNLPPRRQDEGDPVGVGLLNLLFEYPNKKGLKRYLGHWHKMRSSVALRYGDRMETIKEAFLSLKYNPFNYKVMPFIVLALLPSGIRNLIIRKAKG